MPFDDIPPHANMKQSNYALNWKTQMENAPLISVVIPAYNVAAYIEKCIHSILNQSVTNMEVLIYDDGSDDETFDVIKRIEDRRIKAFHDEENRGVVFARNFLLGHTRGQFIALQDADDWSHPDRFETQLKFLTTYSQFAACGTQFVKVVNNRNVFVSSFSCDPAKIKEAMPERFHFLPGSVMMRKSILEKVGRYDPFFANDGNEDIYFTAKILLAGGFSNVDAPLYYYNLNLQSLTKFGELNPRRAYISHITSALLEELIEKGTNALESRSHNALVRLEETVKRNHEQPNSFFLFEGVVGQLVFYRQYALAARQVFEYMMRTRTILQPLRLLLYVIKKSIHS